MSGMKTLLFKTCLPDTTAGVRGADRPITRKLYFGASMPNCGPVDADRARTLLFELWGGLVREGVLCSAPTQFLDRYEADDET